jgi:hypothetical protein
VLTFRCGRKRDRPPVRRGRGHSGGDQRRLTGHAGSREAAGPPDRPKPESHGAAPTSPELGSSRSGDERGTPDPPGYSASVPRGRVRIPSGAATLTSPFGNGGRVALESAATPPDFLTRVG